MKPKYVILLVVFLGASLFTGWQYLQYKKPAVSCGGDFSYNVQCSAGQYCKSLELGPLAGGLCRPYLDSVFRVLHISQIQNTSIPIPEPTTQQPLPPAPSQQPQISELADWQTYQNDVYHYQFHYPQYTTIRSNNFATEPEKSSNISVGTLFYVEALDPNLWEPYKQMLSLQLKEFAQYIYKLNKENAEKTNNTVSDLIMKTINAQPAYTFSLNGSYVDDRGGYVLDTEHMYLFTQKDTTKFIFHYPSQSELSKQIFSTFQFINPQNETLE